MRRFCSNISAATSALQKRDNFRQPSRGRLPHAYHTLFRAKSNNKTCSTSLASSFTVKGKHHFHENGTKSKDAGTDADDDTQHEGEMRGHVEIGSARHERTTITNHPNRFPRLRSVARAYHWYRRACSEALSFGSGEHWTACRVQSFSELSCERPLSWKTIPEWSFWVIAFATVVQNEEKTFSNLVGGKVFHVRHVYVV